MSTEIIITNDPTVVLTDFERWTALLEDCGVKHFISADDKGYYIRADADGQLYAFAGFSLYLFFHSNGDWAGLGAWERWFPPEEVVKEGRRELIEPQKGNWHGYQKT